jgi:acyl transferase domain-containing protein
MPYSQYLKEPIAIIGTGCRFPGGADTASKLWELLSNPRDVSSEIGSGGRFNLERFCMYNL